MMQSLFACDAVHYYVHYYQQQPELHYYVQKNNAVHSVCCVLSAMSLKLDYMGVH